MRALITGGYGFAGRHLAHYLISCGDDVAVTYDPKTRGTDGALTDLYPSTPLPNTVQSLALDVTNKAAVEQLISLTKPDAVYHLAAITFVPQGELNLQKIFEVNAFGTANILDAIVKQSPETRFLNVASSEVYGDPRPGSLPLTEQAVLRPVSTYGIAKATADLATFKYTFTDAVFGIRARPFPHIGPGQNPVFAISSFARQIAEIKLGRAPAKIMVGNLEAKRDYSDVSDIVRGYRDAILNGKRGEAYNLCSGSSVQIGDLLQRLIKLAEVEVEVVVDPDRLRPVDVPDVYGDPSKAFKELGWKPRIDLEATLHSIFAFWIETLASE